MNIKIQTKQALRQETHYQKLEIKPAYDELKYRQNEKYENKPEKAWLEGPLRYIRDDMVV